MPEGIPARDARAAAWSGVGGVLASLGAVASALCCLPIAAGAGGALVSLAGLAFGARPWLLAVAVVLLGFGFWRAYRRVPCPEGEACASPAGRKRARSLLWLAAVLTLLAFTFPYWGWRLYLLF